MHSLSEEEGPPLFTIEDADGVHALVYTTPRRLLEKWGQITAASVPLATLLLGWPEGVDLVLDAGYPQARLVPGPMLEQVALDAAGVPTMAGITFSPNGVDVTLPDAEPVQLIGASRLAAEAAPPVLALYGAEITNREPQPRPVLAVVVQLAAVDEVQQAAACAVLSRAITEADPQPFVLLPMYPGLTSEHQAIIDRVVALDSPYWQRDA